MCVFFLLQLDTVLFEGYRAAGDYESAYVHQMRRLEYVSEVNRHSGPADIWNDVDK